MVLHSAAKEKQNATTQNGKWHPGQSRGADLDRHVVTHCWAWEKGVKEEELIEHIKFSIKVFMETRRTLADN